MIPLRFFRPVSLSFATALLLVCSLSLIQQTNAQVLTSEGVSGDMDAKSRGPLLSVSSTIGTNKVTILADAQNPSKDFDKYPIQFDFFVNRQFFTSQYRSPTLPGPVGIDVPSSVAKPPFNYAVVAKLLHPNSIYTTVIEAAVFTQTLRGSLDCTLTTTPTGGAETIYTAQQVAATQSNNNVFTTVFEAQSENGEKSINVTATITVAARSADSIGSVVLVDGDDTTTVSGDASVEKTSSEITSFTFTSSDDSTTLSCS
jgi:hypothetical protein